MQIKVLFTVLLLGILFSCYSESPKLKITYTGNEGFFVNSKNKKVLVDALFRSNYPDFLAPTETMINQMINGELPYKNIDLLLVTHHHGDHFDPELTIQFLKTQSGCKLVAHKQAVDKMRDLQDFDLIKSQIIKIDSDYEIHSSLQENGIDIDVFCLKHGPYLVDGKNIHGEVRNLAYIVNLEGSRFYHSGDATIKENKEVLGKYNFKQKPVDVMFLQRYDTSPDSKYFITHTVKPDKLIAMHIAPADMDISIKHFMTVYPNGSVFREQGNSIKFSNSVNFHTLSGPYLGQKPPNGKAEVFAPGIISTENLEHSPPSFSPDGKEVVWSVWRNLPGMPSTSLEQVIMYMKEENGLWSYPEISSFSGEYRAGGPKFSPDGQYIFYDSRRPVQNDTAEVYEWKSFYVKRTENGWGSEKEIREIPQKMEPNEVIFFSSLPQGEFPIVKVKNAFYKLPKIDVEPLKNKGTLNWTFYISPDEQMAIFSSNRPGSYEGDYGDLYISQKTSDGIWSEPKKLGDEINTSGQERFPGFSPDGKYLFFTRPREGYSQDVWWVKTEMIQELKTKISK